MKRLCWMLALSLLGCDDTTTTGDPAPDEGQVDATSDAAKDDAAKDAAEQDAAADGALDLDAATPDALTPDALTPDALTPDALTPDALAPDALAPDAAVVPFNCDWSVAPGVGDLPVEGFGAASLGGYQEGGDEVVVTSLENDGPGTLREACRTVGDAPRVIRFGVDGAIRLSERILLPSNLTIDGRGHDIRLVGKGLGIPGRHDIILTHFALEDIGPNSEDGIQILHDGDIRSARIVLDHLRFSQSGSLGDAANVDEAISVVWGSTDITVQWCRFDDWEKILLAGNGDADESIDGQIRLTMHHNFFNRTGRRHPRVRYGQADVYNNYYYDWRMFDYAGPPVWRMSYGTWCHNGCEMRLEQNVFERYDHPKDHGVIPAQWPDQASRCAPDPLNALLEGEFAGTIVEVGRYVPPESERPLEFLVGCPADATVFERPYPAAIETADETLRQRLRACTGNLPTLP